MINIIVAVSENNVIGKGNKLPWFLPKDLKHFKEVTLKSTVIMGRKTFESIGRPLPNRENIIITRNQSYNATGCTVVNNLEKALSLVNTEDCFIIGGSEIYELALPLVDKIYLTKVDTIINDGDAFFKFKKSDWKLVKFDFIEKDFYHEFDMSFMEFIKK